MTDRFAVEECHHRGVGIGDWAIRYTPAARKKPDGSTSFGLSFQALIAGDALGDQKAVLSEVARILNASELGRHEDTPND